MNNILLAFNVQ